MNSNSNNSFHKESAPHVLHARTVTGTGGGPEKTIINSPRFLSEMGYQSNCLFLRPPNDPGFESLRERAQHADTQLIEVDDQGKFSRRMVKQVINHARERNVTIWHAHDYKSNLLGLVVNRYHPMRLVTTAHGWVNFDGMTPFYYWLDKKFFLPSYEKIICVSSTVMEQAIAGGTPKSKCVIIDNAIDHHQFSRCRGVDQAKSEDFGFDREQLVIGSIGRLSPEKGFDLLIKAMSELIKKGINVKLVIAGEGPEKNNLQNLIDDLGISDSVSLLGYCQDTISFYEALDIFVLSSHREGLPNVVLEAMAIGVPVVATNVDGVPKIITDGADGLLVPPGDFSEIGKNLSRLIQNPSLRANISKRCVETIREKWSFHNRMKNVANLYDTL